MPELNTSEAQFLHKLLNDRDLKQYFDAQTRGVSDESFTDDVSQDTWEFIKTYVQRYNRIPALATVQEQVPSFSPGDVPDRFEYYRDKLIRQFHKNKLGTFVTDLARVIQEDRVEYALEFIGVTYQDLVKGARVSDYGKFKEMVDRIVEFQRRVNTGETPIGIPTGIGPLDDHFLGFRPGDYGIISGRPGEGKTTLALFMAFSAFMAGHKVSYVTLEMPRDQLFEKLDALATGISINKIKRLTLTEQELALYQEKAEQISQRSSDIYIHDRTGECTPITIEAILTQDEPDILFIDSIYLMRSQKNKSQWEGIKENSNQLKALALKYRKPIVALSQINREAREAVRVGDAPSLETLSYSDALGQDADHVFVLTSNEKTKYYRAKRLTSAKLRGAGEKDIAVKWDPTTNHIEYLEEYSRLRAPDTNVQQIRDLQNNLPSGSSGGPLG